MEGDNATFRNQGFNQSKKKKNTVVLGYHGDSSHRYIIDIKCSLVWHKAISVKDSELKSLILSYNDLLHK